ncbi:MAG: PilN domain-containing protein [Azoarcus sp.]|jgi:type IV pilus assembly protein PilN|nr:PilN domain-containing protein [Azoarcus sp.]
MIRINLLPHREEKRNERRKQFYTVSAMMLMLGAVVWLLVHMVNAQHIDSQDARNRYIESEIGRLDDVIVEIKDLRGQIDRLLARKHVIETLESNRAETVHLFNELSARLPIGVYLTEVTQSGNRIALKGYAQSNTLVSQLMVSLNESPLFIGNSEFVNSEAETLNNRHVFSFEVNAYIKHAGAPADEAAADAAPERKG